jgi:hypothetical protein
MLERENQVPWDFVPSHGNAKDKITWRRGANHPTYIVHIPASQGNEFLVAIYPIIPGSEPEGNLAIGTNLLDVEYLEFWY